jgi:hypothetical protein
MNLLFRPVGIVLGILGGMVAQKIFDFVWSKVDDEEAPDPQFREQNWVKFVVAMVVQGAIFRIIRGLVDHHSRRAFETLTGTWPGEPEPEPE